VSVMQLLITLHLSTRPNRHVERGRLLGWNIFFHIFYEASVINPTKSTNFNV